jgi:hypothetical protein
MCCPPEGQQWCLCRDALEHAKWIIAVLSGQIDPGPFRFPVPQPSDESRSV